MLGFARSMEVIRSYNSLRADVQACVSRMAFAAERGLEYDGIKKACNAFSRETVALAADWIENYTSVSDRFRNRVIAAMREVVIGL